jgi:peptidoglycan/LPS O-acetylase OafA/YrhL
LSDGGGKIPALTGVRYIAALIVMIGHAAQIMPASMEQGIYAVRLEQGAPVGMSLFFVLSGVVIWLNYAAMFNERDLATACRSFFSARIARLYPMYLATVLLAVAVSGFARFIAYEPWSITVVLMLQSWFPGGGGQLAATSVAWAGHLWSVSTELFFYLAFPLIVPWLSRVKSAMGLLAVLVINLAVYAVLFSLSLYYGYVLTRGPVDVGGSGLMWLSYYSPYGRMFEFVAGCVVAALYLKLRGRLSVSKVIWTASALLVLVASAVPWVTLILAQAHPSHAVVLECISRIAAPAAFSLLLLHICLANTFLSRWLGSSLLVWGGESSYSIYLLHTFFIDNFSFHPGDNVFPGEFAFRMVIYVALITMISWGTFLWIEAPARRWLRELLARRKHAPVLQT